MSQDRRAAYLQTLNPAHTHHRYADAWCEFGRRDRRWSSAIYNASLPMLNTARASIAA